VPHSTPTATNPDQPLTQAERTARAEACMVEAAIELLNTAGIQGTTLVAIGDKAGYSRGLVSHHFGSKAGLFRAVLKRITASWTADLQAALGDDTGIAAFTAAIDAHLAHVLRHPEYIRAQNILLGAALDPSPAGGQSETDCRAVLWGPDRRQQPVAGEPRLRSHRRLHGFQTQHGAPAERIPRTEQLNREERQ
jgi:AcrR family transcriptional regulator